MNRYQRRCQPKRLNLHRRWPVLITSLCVLLLTSCVSSPGIRIVNSVAANNIIESYDVQSVGDPRNVDGQEPDNFEYYLVEIKNQIAIYERDLKSDSGALIDYAWTDAEGEHYVGWIGGGTPYSHAWEYIRTENQNGKHVVKRYVYPSGTYTIVELERIERPALFDPKSVWDPMILVERQ